MDLLTTMLADLLEGDAAPISVPVSACEVHGLTLTIQREALLDAITVVAERMAQIEQTAGVWDGDDGWGGDAPVPKRPTVAHVSPRNDDPGYRQAKSSHVTQWARDLLDSAELKPVGAVMPIPVTHRDDMPEADRLLHAKLGETREDYLGKRAGMHSIHVPSPADAEKELLGSLGIVDTLDQRLFLLQLAFMADRRADLNEQGLLVQVIDTLSGLLKSIREGMSEGAAAVFHEVFATGTAESHTLGQLNDDETGEPVDAWIVQWELPDELVMAVLI
ncbi:hypothetical protein [Acidithiobacillus ferriphilus]|uniref:hypothetical protein n=1 Tax=Acidithiobacillus ferriphilus TaxID=1689834 RepID=UPI001C074F8F|nr:hypothetical protein [Acidithiobacillus ferriphilus]MBU2831876.1 hypothetical protein [Acidithiobacillus ferriphilus]